jgi:hypothetical protein
MYSRSESRVVLFVTARLVNSATRPSASTGLSRKGVVMDPAPPRDSSGHEAITALIQQVQSKRGQVQRYLESAGSRSSRLANVTIVAGTAAAMLTAGPALGGETFANWLDRAVGMSTPSWQILCTLACLCSLAATVATQVRRSNNYDEHIAIAQAVRATLEGLEVGISSGYLGQQEATTSYLECVNRASFIDPT